MERQPVFCIQKFFAAYIYAMDRIIYFYTARGQSYAEEGQFLTKPCQVYRLQQKDYLLIRAGLDRGLVKRWEAEETLLRQREEAFIERPWYQRLFQMPGEKKRRKAIEKRWRYWEAQLALVLEMFGAEGEELSLEDCCFSCEEALEHLLKPRQSQASVPGEIWSRLWRVPVFDSFREPQWVEHMMQYAGNPHFLILGYDSVLPLLIRRYACKMKSLKWILPKECYREPLQDFLEDIYEEYGLAAAVQVLEPGQNLKRAGVACREPSSILDFSGEVQIPTGQIAKGSIWLDMDALEEKCRRMESRNLGIRYVSLKKEWKQPVLP